MSEQQIILDNGFWKFLVSLEELKVKKEIDLFCASLAIDEMTFDLYLGFLSKFKIVILRDQEFIYPIDKNFQFKLDFTLAEWLALQMIIPAENLDKASLYFEQIIRNKMRLAQSTFAQYSLVKKEGERLSELPSFENLKKKIDRDIVTKQVIKLHFFNDKECEIFPHRLVFLDGVLCVIGENIKDKTLLFFSLDDISDVSQIVSDYEPNLSPIEVSEFIGHIRLVNGKVERLVLKFYSQEGADLLPEHHFLGNPFVTSSTEGDLIWAATLEVCDDLLLWLYHMRDRVEILDPGHLRKDFAQFCEIKSESKKAKKAS